MHSFYNAFLLHNEADHGKVNQELDSVQHVKLEQKHGGNH
jgi:hypothetical protein